MAQWSCALAPATLIAMSPAPSQTSPRTSDSVLARGGRANQLRDGLQKLAPLHRLGGGAVGGGGNGVGPPNASHDFSFPGEPARGVSARNGEGTGARRRPPRLGP